MFLFSLSNLFSILELMMVPISDTLLVNPITQDKREGFHFYKADQLFLTWSKKFFI